MYENENMNYHKWKKDIKLTPGKSIAPLGDTVGTIRIIDCEGPP